MRPLTIEEAKNLRPGDTVWIEDEPCRVVQTPRIIDGMLHEVLVQTGGQWATFDDLDVLSENIYVSTETPR